MCYIKCGDEMALTDKQKKRIKADYLDIGSYNAVAKIHGVSRQTVKNVVTADPDSGQMLQQKKEQNTADILAYMDTKRAVVCEILTKGLEALNGPDKLAEATPAQITTAMGTLIDKWTGIAPLKKTEGAFELPARVIAPPFASVFLAVADEQYSEFELAGGRGSTKSSFVSLALVWLLKNYPEFHALCVRKVGNTLRDSVYAQILWAISMLGLDGEFESTVSPMEITLKGTGQKIYFRGADDPKKLKSVTPPFGYIGALWFEELDQFAGEEEVRNIRQSVIRGGEKAFIFKSYNPPKTMNNWVNKAQQTPKPGRLLHKSTYLDVPVKWLGQPFIDEAEFVKATSPSAYEHEYMGIANGTGGLVFENVILREITKGERKSFDRIYNGVDWGYYPDPWAFNQMHYDAARRTLYITGELTRHKMGNRETADELFAFGLTADDRLTADNAEPKSIQDYRNYGLFCRGAEKGPGSVDYSTKWLQSLTQIVIDPVTCPDTAKEFLNYEYERTKDGDIISGYPDRDNHHIDAVRYALEPVWKRRGQ